MVIQILKVSSNVQNKLLVKHLHRGDLKLIESFVTVHVKYPVINYLLYISHTIKKLVLNIQIFKICKLTSTVVFLTFVRANQANLFPT